MSYNGSGVYTLPGAQLANGATVSATENNQFRNDVATALNVAWTRDGQAPATNDIPMGSNKLTELAQPTTEGDALAFGKNATVDDLAVTGNQTVTGNSDVTGNQTVTGNSDVTGNQTVTGNSDVTGNQTVGGNLTVTGTASLGGQYFTPYTGFKNRIINGAMMIDQRNAGASVTPASSPTYTVDRWVFGYSQNSKFTVQQNAGSVTTQAAFPKYLGFTVAASVSVAAGDYFYFHQPIEGLNVSDLAWGTASASTVTLSFWVRSSLTGTFGGSLRNYDSSRSYPFTYTISSANTWEQKSITIAGDTSGTWLTTNGIGIDVGFGLGAGSTYSGAAGSWAGSNYVTATGATSVVGTNGATFYITGVQLEKGSTATSFDYRPYGTELQLCMRYFEQINPGGAIAGAASSTVVFISGLFQVAKRTAPTISGGSGIQARIYNGSPAGNTYTGGGVAATNFVNTSAYEVQVSGFTGVTGSAGSYYAASSPYVASAEL